MAANVEAGRASASFELKSLRFGINGDVLSEAMETQGGDYNEDNFGKLEVEFNCKSYYLNWQNVII
ncbi:hypothetical protein QFZ48_000136 [Chitinophaga sp. W2I13]|uniref:hypothetical protein n=1 Tax=Chitinophaga sp. W2I13 TaxID=3373923 RepID=UPI003D19F083